MAEHHAADEAPPIGAPLPTHPGHFLRDLILPAVTESKSEIADRLGVSRQTLYQVLNGERDLTPELALKLGRLFGNSGKFWMNMQTAFDLAKARAALGDSLAAIKPVEGAPIRPGT